MAHHGLQPLHSDGTPMLTMIHKNKNKSNNYDNIGMMMMEAVVVVMIMATLKIR